MLTVLGGKSDAAVHHLGYIVSAELLAGQRSALSTGSLLDGCVPQGKVQPGGAMDIHCPKGIRVRHVQSDMCTYSQA